MQNTPLFIAQLYNFTFIVLWLVLMVIALIKLGRNENNMFMRVYLLWFFIIFLIPIIEPVIFFVYSRNKKQE
jgi:hypothetical protein